MPLQIPVNSFAAKSNYSLHQLSSPCGIPSAWHKVGAPSTARGSTSTLSSVHICRLAAGARGHLALCTPSPSHPGRSPAPHVSVLSPYPGWEAGAGSCSRRPVGVALGAEPRCRLRGHFRRPVRRRRGRFRRRPFAPPPPWRGCWGSAADWGRSERDVVLGPQPDSLRAPRCQERLVRRPRSVAAGCGRRIGRGREAECDQWVRGPGCPLLGLLPGLRLLTSLVSSPALLGGCVSRGLPFCAPPRIGNHTPSVKTTPLPLRGPHVYRPLRRGALTASCRRVPGRTAFLVGAVSTACENSICSFSLALVPALWGPGPYILTFTDPL